MKIEWNITKKRGNLRPTLSYAFVVEKFEKELALPPILVESTIPEPIDAWQEHCYPNEFERAETPRFKGVYRLEIVSHKGSLWTQNLRLPWRKDNHYPEVEKSFELLRQAFEQALTSANASNPMNEKKSLHISGAAAQSIAASVLAEKFLDFARGNAALRSQ